uniref:TubC protein n=1 Tax=Archangium disciforme TaxID=38 RepID=UPI0001753A0D|nr:Chain A, TubC protein [Archangium disciforme]2JUG_B Chain B, TubC protein [Archangium disciforme]
GPLGSSAGALLAHAASLGVRLWVEGERLRFQAPPGVMTPELQSRLGGARHELIALLRQLQPSSQGGSLLAPVARNGRL